MGQRLILDTNILIAIERGNVHANLFNGDDVAIAAVAIAEMMVGPLLADRPLYAKRARKVVDAFRQCLPILDYTQATAECHARLLAHCAKNGVPRESIDLIIAAHAVETKRTLVSLDAKARFGNLPDIQFKDLTELL